MQTKIEGILINKIVYRERDLIGHLLLRNGEKLSVMFFGGRGGGSKNKPSLLELGYLMKVELKKNQKKEEAMYVAVEWQSVWSHQQVRYEFKAFSLMTFFLELINRVAITTNLDESELNDQEGLFKVLSNSLFYLEKSLSEFNFQPLSHLALFLCKMTFELGVAPDPFLCTFCGNDLTPQNLLSFEMQEGGFCCTNCMQKDNLKSNLVDIAQGKDLAFWMSLRTIWNLKYQDFAELRLDDRTVTDKLYHYLCFQFQIDPKSLKTYSMLTL
ncbi:MAG: DNA repair protein RecO [Bacteriovoracaceae bacterium]